MAVPIVALVAGPVQPVSAATFSIGCNGPTALDNGSALVTAVGASASGDTILLAAPCEYTIPTVPLAISHPLTIQGLGASGTAGAVIDSTNNGSPSPRLVVVNSSSTTPVVLDNITLDGLKGQGKGVGLAGIAVTGSTTALTVSNSVLQNFTGVASSPLGPGCSSYDSGAALCSDSSTTVVMDNDTVQHNSAVSLAGAVATEGSGLTVTKTVFHDNHVTSTTPSPVPEAGGAMLLAYSRVTLSGDTFSNNGAALGSGGAIAAGFTFLTIDSSVFSNNVATGGSGAPCSASGNGGAIADGLVAGVAVAPNAAAVTNSTFTGNSADNLGGAIDDPAAATSALAVSRSTFGGATAPDGNAAAAGAAVSVENISPGCSFTSGKTGSLLGGTSAIAWAPPAGPPGFPFGQATIDTSTFVNNAAKAIGGAVLSLTAVAATTVSSSTIDQNVPSGLAAGYATAAQIAVSNSILSQNGTANCATANGGAIVDGGQNLSWPASDTTCPNTIPTGDPLLDTPRDNGGPTPTQGLNVGSAALAQIPFGATGCGTTDTDQRGVNRQAASPADKCDIGALEVVSTTSTVTLPASAVAGTPVQITDTIRESTPPLAGAKPLGSVTFYDGSTAIGTAPSDPGTAVLTTSALAPGTHSISARYSGSSIFDPSGSAPAVTSISVPVPATGLAGGALANRSGAPGPLGGGLVLAGVGAMVAATGRRASRRRRRS